MDPILGLRELTEGDSLGYLRQNERDLIVARLSVDRRISTDAYTAPPGSVGRSQAWIIGTGGGTGHWAGQPAGTIAIARDNAPTSVAGWYFYAPWTGMEVYLMTGSISGWVQWNGTAWVARP